MIQLPETGVTRSVIANALISHVLFMTPADNRYLLQLHMKRVLLSPHLAPFPPHPLFSRRY